METLFNTLNAWPNASFPALLLTLGALMQVCSILVLLQLRSQVRNTLRILNLQVSQTEQLLQSLQTSMDSSPSASPPAKSPSASAISPNFNPSPLMWGNPPFKESERRFLEPQLASLKPSISLLDELSRSLFR